MSWLIALFVTVFFWAVYDILSAKIPSLFNPLFAYSVISIAQLIIFAVGFLFFEKNQTHNSGTNIWVLIIMGGCLALGNMAFYLAFKKGAPISVAVPISTIGVAILGALWGIIVANEPITFKLSVGLVLSIGGIILMSL